MPGRCLLLFALISRSISVLSVNVSCDAVSFSGVLLRMPKEKCAADDLLKSPKRSTHREHTHTYHTGPPDNGEDSVSVVTVSHSRNSAATFNVAPKMTEGV